MSGLSYKQKCLLLFGLCILLAVVGYQLSIRKTLDVYREIDALTRINQVPIEELNLRLREKLAEKRQLDSLLTMLDDSSGKSDAITQLVKNADQYQLQVVGVTKGGGSNADVHMECALSGVFVNMVKFIRATELQTGISIESLRIHKQTDRSTKEEKLILDLWIRKIKKNA